MTQTPEQYAAGLIERTMRDEGFMGSVDVSEVKSLRSGGYKAKVKAHFRGLDANYNALIKDGKISVKKVG